MRPFDYVRAESRSDAMRADGRIIAGGTNLLDLMKIEVETPERLIDVTRLDMREIEAQENSFRIGALVTNSELAANETVRRDYPVLSRALLAGASGQLRNKATTGGNLLQRTRCPVAGWRNRDPTTVATRARAARARQRYSTSSPQMKNSSRGRPIQSTSSRVTSTPLNVDHDVLEEPALGGPRHVRQVVHDARGAGEPDREAQPVESVLGHHGRSEEVVAVDVLEQVGQDIRWRRPSSSINHSRSAARSWARAMPAWKPPAPPVLRSSLRTSTGTVSSPASRSQSAAVPSVEALSTITSRSGRRVWASTARAMRSSRADRFQVTTTATIRDTDGGTQRPRRRAARTGQQTLERSADWLAAYPLDRLPIDPPVLEPEVFLVKRGSFFGPDPPSEPAARTWQ